MSFRIKENRQDPETGIFDSLESLMDDVPADGVQDDQITDKAIIMASDNLEFI